MPVWMNWLDGSDISVPVTMKKYKTHTEIIEALKSLDYVYHIEEMRA